MTIRQTRHNLSAFFPPNRSFWYTVGGCCCLGILLLCGLPSWVFASSIDTLQQEASRMERDRDCEGAYKKYQEMKEQVQALAPSRRRSGLLAFVATKTSRLKDCYEKCNPSEDEKKSLEQAKDFRQRGQSRRAYRMLLRLLRGKNPRCSSWREAHQWRTELAGGIKTKRHQTSVDPCDMDDDVKQKVSETQTQVTKLQQDLATLQQPTTLPPPPQPPKWAKEGRRYEWWLRRWKQRTQQALQRQAERTEIQRLQQILQHYQQINTLREKIFAWREDFQNCDEVYTSLKEQSSKLRRSQDQAHQAIVGLYDGRMKRFEGRMKWFAGRYAQLQRNQKTDQTSVQALQESLQQQRELLDNVTQDLLALSNLLVFKPQQAGEGTLLQDNMGNFQKLMSDQQAMFAALEKQYPGYMKSEQGRKLLSNQLSALGRFEKVLERFQDRYAGDKSEKIRQTLHQVRGSILLLEKAEQLMARDTPSQTKNPSASSTSSSVAMIKTASTQTGGRNQRSSFWGWVLLLLGLSLALGASWYLWRERNMRQQFINS